MAFGDDFESLLPIYLTANVKKRLKDGLSQFMPEHRNNQIDYNGFYDNFSNEFFRQADLVREIRMPVFDLDTAQYDKTYTDAIILSNTCDISYDNVREVKEKQCLLAPLVRFKDFQNNYLERSGKTTEQAFSVFENIRRQLTTDILYLPKINDEEYLALLDQIFWFPTAELNGYIAEMEQTKISSLSHFGFYLYIFKVSYHLFRMPESCDREVF